MAIIHLDHLDGNKPQNEKVSLVEGKRMEQQRVSMCEYLLEQDLISNHELDILLLWLETFLFKKIEGIEDQMSFDLLQLFHQTAPLLLLGLPVLAVRADLRRNFLQTEV